MEIFFLSCLFSIFLNLGTSMGKRIEDGEWISIYTFPSESEKEEKRETIKINNKDAGNFFMA